MIFFHALQRSNSMEMKNENRVKLANRLAFLSLAVSYRQNSRLANVTRLLGPYGIKLCDNPALFKGYLNRKYTFQHCDQLFKQLKRLCRGFGGRSCRWNKFRRRQTSLGTGNANMVAKPEVRFSQQYYMICEPFQRLGLAFSGSLVTDWMNEWMNTHKKRDSATTRS